MQRTQTSCFETDREAQASLRQVKSETRPRPHHDSSSSNLNNVGWISKLTSCWQCVVPTFKRRSKKPTNHSKRSEVLSLRDIALQTSDHEIHLFPVKIPSKESSLTWDIFQSTPPTSPGIPNQNALIHPREENKTEIFNPNFDYSKLSLSDEIHDLDEDSAIIPKQKFSTIPRETNEISLSNPNIAVPTHIIIKDSTEVNYDVERTEVDPPQKLNQEIKVLPWLQNPDTDNKATFTGPVDDCNRPHGRGILQYENGDSYEGPFHHGLRHGSDGILITYRGTMVYHGEFQNNWKHGHGIQKGIADKYPRYAGGYCKGLPHGYGEGYQKDGSLFHRGQWDFGKPSHRMVPLLNEQDIPIEDMIIETLSNSSNIFWTPVACDESLELSLGPRISRYDPFQRRISVLQDDSSMASDSCLSEVTYNSSDFFSDTSQDLSEYVHDDHSAFGPSTTSNCNSKDPTKIYAQNSILGLGRLQNRILDQTSLSATTSEYNDEYGDWDPIRVHSQITDDYDHSDDTDTDDNLSMDHKLYQISSLPGYEQEI
jgi:hypothetical protein